MGFSGGCCLRYVVCQFAVDNPGAHMQPLASKRSPGFKGLQVEHGLSVSVCTCVLDGNCQILAEAKFTLKLQIKIAEAIPVVTTRITTSAGETNFLVLTKRIVQGSTDHMQLRKA